MPEKPGLRWKIYFFFFFPIAIGGLYTILSSESSVYQYYHITSTLSAVFGFNYALNVLSAIFTLLVVIPLFLFTFDMNFLPAKLWKWVFVLRLCFDVMGRSYEYKFLKSIFYSDWRLGAAAVGLFVLILLPSYVGHFCYAFRQEKSG